MKQALFWFLVGGLLLVAVADIRYYKSIKQRYRQHEGEFSSLIFVSALRGAPKKVVLPDGSTVWLNAASTLSYPAGMASGERTVALYGEGLFDVVDRPSHPFRVQANELFVEVLGTRFSVRDYPDETLLRTQVACGAVRVNYRTQSTVLKTGEAAEIDAAPLSAQVLTIKRAIDTANVATWTRGILRFSDVDLRSFLRDLSRAYNVDIELNGPVSDHHIDGTLSPKEPLEEVIDRLIVPYNHVTVSRPSARQLIITVNQ